MSASRASATHGAGRPAGDFLSRTLIKADLKPLPGMDSGKRVHRETLSPLDSTLYKGKSLPGEHPPPCTKEPSLRASAKPSPTDFLIKSTGLGGTCSLTVSQAAAEKRKKGAGTLSKPPVSGALAPRPNPPNTELRRYYERSDLPIVILQGARNKLQWKVDIQRLDFHHYLPVFFSGLREVEEPYRFVAEEGVYDLLQHGGEAKVLPVIPQLILSIKEALNTRDHQVMIRTLRVLQALLDLGDGIGIALVPYYRQLLPIMNVFINHTVNLGDKIDYHQRFGHLGELIHETIQKMELKGGPDAFINIKYIIATYESAVLG